MNHKLRLQAKLERYILRDKLPCRKMNALLKHYRKEYKCDDWLTSYTNRYSERLGWERQ